MTALGALSRRKAISALSIAGLAAAIGFAALGSASAETTLERARKNGYIRVGFANEAPFGYATPEGKLTGEAPEVAKAVLKEMGINQVDGVLTEFGSLIPGLQAGRFDIIAAGMKRSPVSTTVDFEQEGVQHGFLRLPHSRDDSAWGSISIPVTTIKGGEGPTVLLTGANHGDEYEGPAALFELAQSLDPSEVNGRIIIVPALNYPAFRAGTRTSPIDRGNLNRSFPGRPDGTVTEKIADYVTRHLIPLADIVLDFHSGGRTLDFLPYAAAHELPDKAQEARCFEAVAAFAAPYSMRMLEIDAVGMSFSAWR